MASWNATTQAQPAAQEKEYIHSTTPTVYEPSHKGSREGMSAAPGAAPELPSQNGVDVEQAKEEFAHLRRELTRQSKVAASSDIEKQVCEFDWL
jgi:hypothetical protein